MIEFTVCKEYKERGVNRESRPTALREIKKTPKGVQASSSFGPLCQSSQRGPLSIWTLQAYHRCFRSSTLRHRTIWVGYTQSANLLTRHRDRATLQPKDIRMARRIKGEDESVGITPEAATQWGNDWKAFSEQRLTSKKALYMEAARWRRLREPTYRKVCLILKIFTSKGLICSSENCLINCFFCDVNER